MQPRRGRRVSAAGATSASAASYSLRPSHGLAYVTPARLLATSTANNQCSARCNLCVAWDFLHLKQAWHRGQGSLDGRRSSPWHLLSLRPLQSLAAWWPTWSHGPAQSLRLARPRRPPRCDIYMILQYSCAALLRLAEAQSNCRPRIPRRTGSIPEATARYGADTFKALLVFLLYTFL